MLLQINPPDRLQRHLGFASLRQQAVNLLLHVGNLRITVTADVVDRLDRFRDALEPFDKRLFPANLVAVSPARL
ncbi:hypothetical protein D3C74_312450 [compost metagenome]